MTMNWKQRLRQNPAKRHPSILPIGAKGFNPLTHVHFTNPETGKQMVIDVKSGIAAVPKLPEGELRNALVNALRTWADENGQTLPGELMAPPQPADEVPHGTGET